jgi:type II secretory pathway pseudopilin PulG
MVDLIVMIVMIVFLLGMGTLAFLTYDKAQKEKQYLAALREIPARQQAEIDSVKARYAEVCRYVGFKGDAAVSSPDAIDKLRREGARVVADYYSLPVQEKPLEGTKATTIPLKVYDKETGEWKDVNLPVEQIDGSQRNAAQIYQEQDVQTIQAALGAQDYVINELVSKYIPRVREQRGLQKSERDTAMNKKASETSSQFTALGTAIETANSEIKTSQETVASSEQKLAEAMKQESTTYAKLDSQAVRDAREAAFAAAREAAVARKQAREAMEAYRIMADKRRTDDSRDPDGAVFLVDDKSGYVWINIGQENDVRKNQTFQVLRADASRDSNLPIGEIRVQEVLRGNIARCRVDALDDPDIYPEAGDIIKNPNFSKRQYRSWALVGQFGGKFTTLTRQQLTDLLRSSGFRVQSHITDTTDAVIIGGNWDQDKDYQHAEEQRWNFEKYPEREVLYFLGMIGPDATR